ncbi:MAG: hypothetical protein ABW168_16795 [Sedimenticola sp.]
MESTTRMKDEVSTTVIENDHSEYSTTFNEDISLESTTHLKDDVSTTVIVYDYSESPMTPMESTTIKDSITIESEIHTRSTNFHSSTPVTQQDERTTTEPTSTLNQLKDACKQEVIGLICISVSLFVSLVSNIILLWQCKKWKRASIHQSLSQSLLQSRAQDASGLSLHTCTTSLIDDDDDDANDIIFESTKRTEFYV